MQRSWERVVLVQHIRTVESIAGVLYRSTVGHETITSVGVVST